MPTMTQVITKSGIRIYLVPLQSAYLKKMVIAFKKNNAVIVAIQKETFEQKKTLFDCTNAILRPLSNSSFY